jgi:ribonuclease G
MIHEIEDWIKKYKNQNKEKKLILKVHPSLGAKLKEGIFSTILKLQSKYFVKIKLVEDNKISPQEFHFFSASTEKEITEIVK